jgi:hypothetical protein
VTGSRRTEELRVPVAIAVGWLGSLPLLAVGMGCFWLQREAAGAAGVALGVLGPVALAVALIAPGPISAWRAGQRGLVRLLLVSGRALLVAVAALVPASLLSMIEALRPEEVSFFGQDFAAAHAIAAAVPTVLAVAAVVANAWIGAAPRRFALTALAVTAGMAGVLAWQWSAGAGYDAIRFTNADEIVLMAQTVTLAGLLLASVGNAVAAERKRSATDAID